MTDKQLTSKVERLSRAYMNWSAKADRFNSGAGYYDYTLARVKKANDMVRKYEDSLCDLMQSITEAQYDSAELCTILCCEWEDHQ